MKPMEVGAHLLFDDGRIARVEALDDHGVLLRYMKYDGDADSGTWLQDRFTRWSRWAGIESAFMASGDEETTKEFFAYAKENALRENPTAGSVFPAPRGRRTR